MLGMTPSRLLIAHPDAAQRELFEHLLEDGGYSDVLTTDPVSLVDLCAVSSPDLILMSCDAPHMALDALVTAARDAVPDGERLGVLLIGERADGGLRETILTLAPADFVATPVDPAELLNRVGNLLQIHELRAQLKRRGNILDEAVAERTLKVEQAQVETLTVLSSLAEYHDDETRHHAQRVGVSSGLIAKRLGLPSPLVARIREAAALHDLGKVGISRRVLLKPGKLTAAERENMMRHVEIGAQLLDPARSPILRLAAEIVRTHHERWDGNGYLAGLRGEEIPLSGRITAVADVFDALVHDRPYRPAWDFDLALQEIATEAGHHFDPAVVEAFHAIDRDELSEATLGEGSDHSPFDGSRRRSASDALLVPPT
jgi:putative two-component system response regulator